MQTLLVNMRAILSLELKHKKGSVNASKTTVST